MKITDEKNENLLYDLMIRKGYEPSFAVIISGEMRTPYTKERMIRYIAANDLLPMEEVADEMMAILAERDKLVNKHISEHAQRAINEYYNSRKGS